METSNERKSALKLQIVSVDAKINAKAAQVHRLERRFIAPVLSLLYGPLSPNSQSSVHLNLHCRRTGVLYSLIRPVWRSRVS